MEWDEGEVSTRVVQAEANPPIRDSLLTRFPTVKHSKPGKLFTSRQPLGE